MTNNARNRQNHILLFFVLATALLVWKAIDLQVIDNEFRSQATAVAVDRYTRFPSRGLIYDRNNELLVQNSPMYDLLVTYNQMDPEMDTTLFCSLLGIEKDFFKQALDKDWSSPRFRKSIPFVFMSKVPARVFGPFQERLYQFPGFELQLRNAREYPIDCGSQVLGYIGEVDQNQVDRSDGDYAPGDYIGASGLEMAYEDVLKGEKGVSYVLKDNLGRPVSSYKGGKQDRDAVAGTDLISTLDIELQCYAEQLMQNKIGSIVAIEPSTGEILAMVTSPTYPASTLTITNNQRGAAFKKLELDPNKPLFNRSTMAQYPPGSLFKPIVALIAMQEGVLNPNRTMSCSGAYFFGGQALLGCHSHPTCHNVEQAIQYSCNNYFVTVFREVIDQFGFQNPDQGLDVFNEYLEAFGMGRQIGIDHPGEKPGNYPSSAYFDRWYGDQQRWNSIWIRSLGIGQGELLTTNLQLANMAAAIANRGWYYPPHLVKGYRYSSKSRDPYFDTRQEIGIDPVHFEPVINGMEKVVTSGTATMAWIPDISVCGKTGTAENPHGEDHSIFFCFAPKENPQIAVAVYVENSGFGGTWAAPIASLVIEKYINGTIKGPQRLWQEQRILEANFIETPELLGMSN